MAALKPPAPAPPPLYSSFVTVHPLQQARTHTHTHRAPVQQQWRLSPCLPVSVFADWLWKKSFSMLNVKVSHDVLLITLCGGRSEKNLFLKWSARQRETCRREGGKKKERQKRKDINKQTNTLFSAPVNWYCLTPGSTRAAIQDITFFLSMWLTKSALMWTQCLDNSRNTSPSSTQGYFTLSLSLSWVWVLIVN